MFQQKIMRLLEQMPSTGELLDVVAYDNERELYLCKYGYMAFAFMCQPVPGAGPRLDKQLEALTAIEYPVGTFTQTFMFASPDILGLLEQTVNARQEAGNLARVDKNMHALTKVAIEREVEFIREGTMSPIIRDSRIRMRDLKTIYIVKLPFEGEEPSEKDIEDAISLKGSVEHTLEATGLMPNNMDARAMVHELRTLVNWGPDAHWRHDPLSYDAEVPICDQIFDSCNGVKIPPNGANVLNLGSDRFLGIASIRRWPGQVDIGMMPFLIGDLRNGHRGVQDNFFICTSVFYGDSQKMKAKLGTARQTINYQAYGPLMKWNPRLASQKESFDALFAHLDHGERPVKATITFGFFGDSVEDVKKNVAAASTYYREMDVMIMQDPVEQLMPIFLNAMPFGAKDAFLNDTFRYKTMSTTHAANLLPVVGEWKGMAKKPILTMLGRLGQAVAFDFFASPTSYNFTISATSGAGKSYLTNRIILGYLSVGGNVFVIDVGRSYEKLVKAIGGRWIEFEVDSDICLNPFPLVGNWKGEDGEVLRSIVTTMASPKGTLTEFQESRLGEIMGELWEEMGKEMSIDAIAEACKADEDSRVRDVGAQLFQFTTQGDYGRFFNGVNNAGFEGQMVALELDGLQGKPHLMQVVMMMLISQVERVMYGSGLDTSVPKLLILDEAWQQLSSDASSVAQFLQGAFRKFRKSYGAAGVITQSLSDLYATKSGRAIADNAPSKLILQQTKETIKTLQKEGHLALDDYWFEVLKSVATKKGYYSEILFYTQGGTGVARFVADRYSQLLYTTDGDERTHINYYRKQGMSIPQAIDSVLQDEARGIRAPGPAAIEAA